jgi:hypothetical protein
MKNGWKMCAYGLVVVVMGVMLLGAMSPVYATNFSEDEDDGLSWILSLLAKYRVLGVFPGDGVDGPALSYRDNHNGTTTDLNTRLMWEQKLSSAHTACTAADQANRNVHCVNNVYTWDETVTVFLDTLNNKCDGGGSSRCTRDRDCRGIGSGKCGFAGYRDWRIANIKELQSIVDYGAHTPPAAPNFPGATAVFSVDHVLPYYWSSTSQIDFPSMAWFVDFDYGTVSVWDKHGQNPPPFDNTYGFCVRAVRGGPQ